MLELALVLVLVLVLGLVLVLVLGLVLVPTLAVVLVLVLGLALGLALVPALELVTSSACTGSRRCWPVLFLLPDSLAVVMARDAGPVSWNLRWSNMNGANVLPEKH